MDGFEVTVGTLRDASAAGGSVVGDVRDLPLADAAAAVGAALPGGAVAAAAATLAEAWRAQVAAAEDAVRQHATALRTAADGYDAAERGAVAALGGER